MKSAAILLVIFFMFTGNNLSAQLPFPKLKLKFYTVADGLSNNNVSCITQDHSGFIWIGTLNGLNRFDGNEFQVYNKKAGDTNSITSNEIREITEDSSQRLWLATGEGLCWLDLNSNKIHRFNNKALSQQIIYYVLLQGKNNLWIATKEYVHCLNLENFSFHSFKISNEQEYKYQQRANNLFFYNDSSLYISGWDGLYCLNTKTGISNHVLKTNYFIDAICYAGNGRLWLGTWASGACLYDINSRQITGKFLFTAPWKEFNDFNITSDIKRIHLQDGREYYWVSGNHGIMIADAVKNTSLMIYNPETGFPLTKKVILTKQIFADRDGNLWISSEGGFARIDLHQHFYDYEPADLNFQTEMTGIFKDVNSTNNLWLALYGDGMVEYNTSSQEMSKKYFPNSSNFSSKLIFSCKQDADKGFWISNGLGGIHYFNLHNKTFRYFNDPLNYDPLHLNIVLKIIQADNKKLWFACKAGLGCFDPLNKSYRYYFYYDTSKPHFIGDHRSVDIFIDNHQRLWITTQFDGCYIFDRNKFSFKKIPVLNADNSEFKGGLGQTFAQDNSGNIWLGTTVGLFLYNEKQERFSYQNIKALPDYISSLCADDNNNLWLLSGADLFRYNTTTKSLQNYSIADGLLPEEGLSINRISGNLISIGYRAKFLLFHSNELKPKQNIEPVRLTKMEILHKDSLITVASSNQLLKFDYKDNDIRFDFKLLDFSEAHSTQYAFMLQGADDKWNYGGSTNSAIYTNIPEGKYSFIVKAANASGSWSQPFKLAYFSIATPYWHTAWFRIAIVFTIAAIVYLIYSVRQQQKKQLSAVRIKIARDLHDDVGSTLSSLQMVSALAEKKINEDLNKTKELLGRITESSERMTGNMQDIVWAVNPLNDSFSEIIARMQKFAAQLLEAKNIELFFDTDEKIKSLKVPLQYRSDLFMIFKEAVNNIAKYSNAAHAYISINKNNKHFLMEIKDDGIGFNTQHAYNGNGLRNMYERAKNLNASLNILSVENEGTKITLEFII